MQTSRSSTLNRLSGYSRFNPTRKWLLSSSIIEDKVDASWVQLSDFLGGSLGTQFSVTAASGLMLAQEKSRSLRRYLDALLTVCFQLNDGKSVGVLLEQSFKLISLFRLPRRSHDLHLPFLKELLDVLQA